MVFLLGVIYYLEEIRNRSFANQVTKTKKIFSAKEITSATKIKINKISFFQEKNKYYISGGNFRADKNRMETLLNNLISISVKEEIKINKTVPLEFYFPEGSRTVEFINGNNINRVTIGNKLRYDRYFYLRYKQNNLEKIYLAYVDQPYSF